MRTRADRDAERQKWAEEMGLLLRHNCKTDNPFIERFLVYEWPKDAGRQFDRDVIVTVYEDGSWGCALDDGTIKLAESKDTMQRMALAAEHKSDEPRLSMDEASFLVGRTRDTVPVTEMPEEGRKALIDKLHVMGG